MASSGESRWLPGERYLLDADRTERILDTHRDLRDVGNTLSVGFSLALRWFEDAYGRRLYQDRLLADMTALEALMLAGVKDELKFRLAYRVASVLGDTDKERVALFREIRDFYDVRSTVAHGEALRPREEALLQREGNLRTLLRRCLNAFLHLHGSAFTPNADLFTRLDEVLLDAGELARLRSAAGLATTSSDESRP